MAYNFSQDYAAFLGQRSPYGEDEEQLQPQPLTTVQPFAPAAPKTVSSTPAVAEAGPKPLFNPTQATQVGDFGSGALTQNTPTFRNTAPPPPPPAAPLAPAGPKPEFKPTAEMQTPAENLGPGFRNTAPTAPTAALSPKPAWIPKAGEQIPDFGTPAPTDKISGTEREFQMPTGQSVTDFVNFDRVLAANLEGMKRQLGKVAGRVDAKASGARGGLQSAMSRFDDLVSKGRKQYQAKRTGATDPVAAITTPRPEDQGVVAGAAPVGPYGPAPGSATTTAGDGTTTTSSAMVGEAGDLGDEATASRGRSQGGPSMTQATNQSQIDSKVTPTEAERAAGDAQTPRQELGNTGTIKPPPAAPAAPSNEWSDADLERMAREGYSGPNSLVDDPAFEDLAKQIVAAQRGLDASKSGSGLAALFQDMVGEEGKAYSRGQSKFDAALTGAAEGGEHKLSALRSKYGNMEKLLGDSIRTTKTIGEQAKREAQDTAAAYKRDLDARRPAPSADKPYNPAGTPGNTTKNKSFEEFTQGGLIDGEVGSAVNRGLREFVEMTDWANPNKWVNPNERSWGSRGADAVLGDNPFNPDEKDVYEAFTQDEIDHIMSLPHDQRRALIEAKKKQIRGG